MMDLVDGGGLGAGNSGHVRVYEWNDSNEWIKVGVDLDGEEDGDQFGSSMSLSSDGTILATGPGHPIMSFNFIPLVVLIHLPRNGSKLDRILMEMQKMMNLDPV